MRVLAVLLCLTGIAGATNVSRYDRVKVSQWRKQKGGPVVGAKITVALIRMDSRQKRVNIGLMPSRASRFTKDAVMNPDHDLWLHRFDDVVADDLPIGQWVELELKVEYRPDGPIRPGQKYQLATNWPMDDAKWHKDKWSHVWGPNWSNGGDGGWGEPEITLPDLE